MEEDKANDWGIPHAFHLNLPPNHMDVDGIPFITKFAHKKARMIVQLALSINLTEDMFAEADDDSMDIDEDDIDNNNAKETLVSRHLLVAVQFTCGFLAMTHLVHPCVQY